MMTKKDILVLLPCNDAHRKQLEKVAPQSNFIYADTNDELDAAVLEKINIIIGNPRRKLLAATENLEWMQLSSAGADLYVKPGLLKENVILTNATGCYGLAISEYMIAMVLSLFLKLPRYQMNQEKHVWHNEGSVQSIFGSTALVVGLGNIGSEFAKRFRALGGSVIGIRRSDTSKPDYVDELYLIDKLDKVLPRADIVALTLPETPQTHKLFGKEKFEQMKSGAILLNVGRGKVVDTDALCDALNSGHLGGAVLDVTDPEPLPPDHPLWNAKNVLLTPHVSGNFNLPETYERVFEICTDNLGRYFRGEKLKNIVDFRTGYKKHDSD